MVMKSLEEKILTNNNIEQTRIDKLEEIRATVTKEYLKAFPELAKNFAIYYCDSADGVTI